MKTTPENQKLMDLITDARKGELVLPQFQRNFVWSRDDITSLLVSILQGHFIGTFLFLETDKDKIPFSVRAIEGIDIKEENLKPSNMILDGQQRLTSINYALSAPNIPVKYSKYSFRFYLDLKKITTGDLENAFSNDYSGNTGKRLDRDYQFKEKIIPVTILDEWDKWINEYERWLVSENKEKFFSEYFDLDKPAWNNVIKEFKDFFVPTVSISKINPEDPYGLAHVCAIFEKLNSTGVQLSVYDLLTARMYRHGIDLHKMWEKAIQDYHLLAQFSRGKPDYYGVYLLRTIALIREVEVRSRFLINLSPENFKKDWNLAIKYMEEAFKRIISISVDGFGAFSDKWVPYTTMISPLAAMLFLIDSKRLDHNAYKLLKRWYWSSVFRERYGGSVESTITRDYQDFRKAIDDPMYEPEAIKEARQNIVENKAFNLKDVNRVNSVYRSVMCLIALNGAKDFRKDDSIAFHDLEDHHIFPKGYLDEIKQDAQIKDEHINCIINRTLIADKTNNEIRKKKPSKYVADVIPAASKKEVLKSHYIQDRAIEMMESDDFYGFLKSREKDLLKVMHQKIMNG